MEEAITFAKKYLEDLLSFFGLNVDVHATHDEDVIELNIPSTHLNGFLIGQRGDTVRALQYMVMSALLNKQFEYHRVNVDVADYKKAQNDRLAEQVEHWVAEVKASGKDMELRPMNPAFRRIVHKVAGDDGLETESVGDNYDRRVIIKAPAAESQEEPEDIEEPLKPEAKKPTKKTGVKK
jgi:spoIIIJ-associated protein